MTNSEFDSLCDEFEAACHAGDRPDIHEYLNRVTTSQRGDLLQELLQIELWWRRDETPSPTVEEYHARFPDFADSIQSAFQQFHQRSIADHTEQPDPDVTFVPSASKVSAAEDATFLSTDENRDSAAPTSGDRLRYFGEYELLEEIARGGMGVVFKARQVKLNRIVALKMILSGQLAGSEEVQRFKIEAEAAANLDHPGIVPIYEIGEHKGQHYFSMGFVEGQSLADRVKDGPLPPREAAEIVRKVAEAVAYAHENGVIHRDLKPANVLLDANGEPRVTDFGLAKQIESDSDLTRTGTVMGTPSYMPPEQAAGKMNEVGPAADVYSLGAILYCLLTGRPPFESANTFDVLLQVLEREPPAPRQLDQAIPVDAETMCLKALAKEPSRRYGSSLEFASDLGRWIAGEPIIARRVTWIEKSWLWCKRQPFSAGMIAAVVLVVMVSGLLVAAQRYQNRKHVNTLNAESVRKRVGSVVDNVQTARGQAIPLALHQLLDMPEDLVRDRLELEWRTAEPDDRVKLAYGLALFDDVRTGLLVSQAVACANEECPNLILALAQNKEDAQSDIDRAVHELDAAMNWKGKARMAVLALYLGSSALADQMCRSSSDPIQRTVFIDELKGFHGDTTRLAQIVRSLQSDETQSAVFLAVSQINPIDLTRNEEETWKGLLDTVFRSRANYGVHSAVELNLSRWQIPISELPLRKDPLPNTNWFTNTLGMTMCELLPGTFDRYRELEFQPIGEPETIHVSRFYIGSKEVSLRQFREFDPEWKGFSSSSPTLDHPVNCTGYADAVRFCNWLSLKEGKSEVYEADDLVVAETQDANSELEKSLQHDFPEFRVNWFAYGYRLPTEAEWEYACRAGAATPFNWGSDTGFLKSYCVAGDFQSKPCGHTIPNVWGCLICMGTCGKSVRSTT